MNIPTVSEYMAKLDGNPQIAAEFAAATSGKSRREAVEACHRLATATLAEIEINKSKLAAARAKVAALGSARTKNLVLKADLAIAKNKLADLQKQRHAAAPAQKAQLNFMKTTPLPTKAPIPQATATAASYATQPLSMLRSEFEKLTAQDKNRFMRDGGKLI